MKIYHQTGFRHNWNVEAFKNNVGDGIIYSPVNIDADKLLGFDNEIKTTGFLDPQLYLLNEAKGSLDTYPYFPGNIINEFETSDLDNSQFELAKKCIDYQVENNFEYIVIPTRYYDDNPTNYFIQSSEYFVEPFCSYVSEHKISNKVLLSVIVKGIMLSDQERFNETLNWITGHQGIDGVYLIFENNFSSKQIKDFDYLLNALKFIDKLKQNELEVHIGYCNTESLIYAAAMPDSISIGSYENLRSFGIKRFVDSEKTPMRAPNARLYSSKLLQWVDYEYVKAMQNLVEGYENFFDDSRFRPLMFSPEFNWHFAKAEPYKHFFEIYHSQIKALPQDKSSRIDYIKTSIKSAIANFNEIERSVLLDENSDGSHLANWYNVLNAYSNN